MTRPAEVDCPLQDQLTSLGATVLSLPLIQPQAVSFNLPDTASFDWVLFTSQQAVSVFMPKALSQIPLNRFPKIGVVGPKTATLLTPFGLKANLIPATYSAEALAEALIQQAGDDSTVKVLWPCGAKATPVLKDRLLEAGLSVTPITVYETVTATAVSQRWQRELNSGVDAILFTSPSAAETFYRLGLTIANAKLGCLGPSTAKAVSYYWGNLQKNRLFTAQPHTFLGMAEATLETLNI